MKNPPMPYAHDERVEGRGSRRSEERPVSAGHDERVGEYARHDMEEKIVSAKGCGEILWYVIQEGPEHERYIFRISPTMSLARK